MRRDGPGMFPGKKIPPPDPQPELPKSPAEPRMDKVEKWRFDRLVAAGFTETQSLWLALDRNVDLHKAVDLAGTAGAQTAFQIIS